MRYLINHLRTIALFIAALALVGCAQVPRASLNEEIKAKQFAPQAETASLYIFRDEIFGGAISMPVNLNNQNLGYTGPKSFFYLNVAPGRYTIESMAENQASLSIDVEAAKNYYVWQEVKMGVFQARSSLTQTDEARGRQGVQASKMIAVKPGIAFAPTGGAPATAAVPTPVAPAPAPVARTVAPVQATAPSPAPAAAPAAPTTAQATPAAPTAAAVKVPAAATVNVVSPAQQAPAAAAPTPASKKESRLQWLKQMRDANLISASEYEAKRQQVLSAP